MIGCPGKLMFTTNISPRTYFEGLYEQCMKFERQISQGKLPHIGPETEGLYCFYCATLNFEQKLPKTGTLRQRHTHKRPFMSFKHHQSTCLVLKIRFAGQNRPI